MTKIFQSNLGLFSSSLLERNEISTLVLLQDSSFCVEKLGTDLLCLKQNSDGCYEETQMCIGLSGVSYTNFVYYPFNGLVIVKVKFDKEQFQKLNSFYKDYVVPQVLKKERNHFFTKNSFMFSNKKQ